MYLLSIKGFNLGSILEHIARFVFSYGYHLNLVFTKVLVYKFHVSDFLGWRFRSQVISKSTNKKPSDNPVLKDRTTVVGLEEEVL